MSEERRTKGPSQMSLDPLECEDALPDLLKTKPPELQMHEDRKQKVRPDFGS